MASGIVVGDEKLFGWTVDAHVGPGCPNRPEDVQLVQFGYHCKIRNPKAASDNAAFTAQEKATIMSIVPGEPYAGLPSEKLTIAIRAHQRVRGGTQDGRVSPVGNASGFYGSEKT